MQIINSRTSETLCFSFSFSDLFSLERECVGAGVGWSQKETQADSKLFAELITGGGGEGWGGADHWARSYNPEIMT